MYEVLISQQYLETVPNLERKFFPNFFHVKRIKRLDFNKELRSGKAFFRSFSSASSRQFDRYIISNLIDGKPDVVLLHVGFK